MLFLNRILYIDATSFIMAAETVTKPTVNLSCLVCNQLFKNPKYLPCCHFYCEECIENMMTESKVMCPKCKQDSIVPAGRVEELPNNFFVSRLVDECILKRKVDGEENVRCENCDEDDPVAAYCTDCSQFLCHFCSEVHKRAKSSRSHGTIPLTELRANKDIQLHVQVKIPLCQEHDEQLKYYCETCEQLVCMYCTVKDHHGHSHDTVKKMASKHKHELKEITVPVEDMITSLSRAHDNIDKMRVQIEQQGDEVNVKIDQHYNELVRKLMEQKEQLKQQVCDIVSQNQRTVTTQLEEVKYLQSEILSMKELQDALEKCSDQEALSIRRQVIDHTQKLANSYKKLNCHPVQTATIEFVSRLNPFPQFGQLLTSNNCHIPEVHNHTLYCLRVDVAIIAKNSNRDCCVTRDSQVSVKVHSSTGEMRDAQVRKNSDGSYTASFVAQQIGDVKLSVCIDEEGTEECTSSCIPATQYTAVNMPSKIIQTDGKPCGIAFAQNGSWALTDSTNHCVYIFDGQDQLIRKFGSKGSNKGQFNYPYGATFDSDGFLYISDFSNNRIQKFDADFNCVLQFGSASQLSGPRGITAHQGMVYVANRESECITVFLTGGSHVRDIGRGKTGWPYDVAIGTDDCLLVVDFHHDFVHVFALDGHYITSMCDTQISSPYGITADPNGSFLIAEYGNNQVSVFDKDGNFVHRFGSRGNCRGHLQSPTAIALSPNGSVYVSDYGNSRIQIFSAYRNYHSVIS